VLILILHFSVYLEEKREQPEVVPPPSTDKKEPPSPDKKPRNKADIQSDQSGTEGLVFLFTNIILTSLKQIAVPLFGIPVALIVLL
jgi:hypothetical protein